MAGLYIHIPYCKSRCSYCSFYSTTLHNQGEYVEALLKEMELRKEEWQHWHFDTVYLGGGTPSVLSLAQLQQLIQGLKARIGTWNPVEVTMECNPDDVTPELATGMAALGINRVSMGVQSFDNGQLRFIHRRHTAEKVEEAVEALRQAGIRRISIDLIYGFPGQTLAQWNEDISRALQLKVEHLSAYALSYEEGTLLYRMREKGEVKEIDEELSLMMYKNLRERLQNAHYEHYEISNFALHGLRSQHNSSYWNGTPYIGLGAAAHSFDGDQTRRWNVADINLYISRIAQGGRFWEEERLTAAARYDEMVMLGLRTCEGINLERMEERFGSQQVDYCLRMAEPYLSNGELSLSYPHLKLTASGIFISDMIMSDLFADEP